MNEEQNKEECGAKLKVSRYSDSLPPYEQFPLFCRRGKGHNGLHQTVIWTSAEGGSLKNIDWKS